MASSLAKQSKPQLQYDKREKSKFKKYFFKPKAKRGRPPKKKRKRKRGRPKKQEQPIKAKQTMMSSTGNEVVDLTAKDKDDLDARLEGTLQSMKRGRRERINWDKGQPALHRKRCADSWFKSADLFEPGESFGHFCKRMAIDRNVLKRYLKGKYLEQHLAKRRGRPSLLSVSVMTHLCEGNCMRDDVSVPHKINFCLLVVQ
jgi:hypothetical protein